MPTSLPRAFGPYLLLEQIAVGGMAEVYLAKTVGIAGFEKYLALKVILPSFANDPEFIEMLLHEAKLAVGLQHPNIVQVFDLGREQGTYYISMEYIDGMDLFHLMRGLSQRDIDVPFDVAAFMAQEICAALGFAHAKRDTAGRPLQIIHRDVSPQNVLLSRSGEVKLVDFGIAKAASRTRSTQVGVIKGKYFYMSPEQASGETVDHRTDIFSAGIILYEMITGRMLYLEEDMTKLARMVRRAEIPPPSTLRVGIPPDLEKAVMKALAKRPEDRWPSAQAFQLALGHFLFSFAPDFTPHRLAPFLQRAAQGETERQAAPSRDRGEGTRRISRVALMSRADFSPDHPGSIVFGAGHLDRMLAEIKDANKEARPTGRRSPGQGTMVVGSPLGGAEELTVSTFSHPQAAAPPGRDVLHAEERTERDMDSPAVATPDSDSAAELDMAGILELEADEDDDPTPVDLPHTALEKQLGAPRGAAAPLLPTFAARAATPPADRRPDCPPAAVPRADRTFRVVRPAGLLGGGDQGAQLGWWRIALAFTATCVVGLVVIVMLRAWLSPQTIEVIAVPREAAVVWNGQRVAERTPVTFAMKTSGAPHVLEVEAIDFRRWREEIRFAAGQRALRRLVVLEPLFGRLELRSDPPGATVIVNGRPRGRTPAVGYRTVDALSVLHDVALRLEMEGFAPVSLTLPWQGAAVLRRSVTMARAGLAPSSR